MRWSADDGLSGAARRWRSRRAAPATALALLVTIATARADADGGAVCAHETVGGLSVTVFVAPVAVRVGLADLSVMVQDAGDSSVLLDADVSLSATPRDADAPAPPMAATHEQATNKLLYAAPVTLAAAGEWHVRAAITRGDRRAEVGCTIQVAPALPPVLTYWPYFAFPPVVVALFVLHQWLVTTRGRGE